MCLERGQVEMNLLRNPQNQGFQHKYDIYIYKVKNIHFTLCIYLNSTVWIKRISSIHLRTRELVITDLIPYNSSSFSFSSHQTSSLDEMGTGAWQSRQ